MIRAKYATHGNTIGMGRQHSFTGRTKQMFSPIAGRTLTYYESFTVRVTPTRSTPPDVGTMKNTLNAQLASGVPESNNTPIDAQCDSVLLIQGAISDQYKFRTWIAETQSASLSQNRLIADWIIAAVIIAILITVVVGAVLVFMAFMAVAIPLLPSKPSYVGGTDPNNPTVFDDWASYLSSQNQLYWYVCPKCGAGFGLKSSYPNVANVPAEEVALFNEHKKDCLGIPQTLYDVKPLLIWSIVGVGAVVFVAYGMPKIISAIKS